MERYDRVAAVIPAARQADVAYDTNQPPAGNERVETAPPNSVERRQKLAVFGNVAQLSCALLIALQRPIGRRRQH